MTKPVQVRNLSIGEGIPKICVPLVGATLQELMAEAKLAAASKADLVEWRVDFLGDTLPPSILDPLRLLRESLGNLPLLFTFRTAEEGGQKAVSREDYLRLNREAVSSGLADLIDIQLFMGDEVCRELIDFAHSGGVMTVLSNHDFQATPPRKELLARLRKMEDLGGDLPKIAVMPETAADVLTLLSATEEAGRTLSSPVITMSMGGLGSLSRISGAYFGSALTFGALKSSSAPGQLDAEDLHTVLRILQESFGE